MMLQCQAVGAAVLYHVGAVTSDAIQAILDAVVEYNILQFVGHDLGGPV